jgi:hypothetical protein
LFFRLRGPERPLGKKTDASVDLFPVILLNFGVEADGLAVAKSGPKANK